MFRLTQKCSFPALMLVMFAGGPLRALHGQVGPAQVAPSELWRDPTSLNLLDRQFVSLKNPLPEMLARGNGVDADLNALAVISSDKLCVVGHCGVILLSKTAGRTWTLVDCPTTDNLRAVCFLDSEQSGLAVGGSIGTYSGTSRGVVLRTADGGLSWQAVPNELPRLIGLTYASGRLLAWGDYSPRFRTSVFESRDGGSTWQPVSIQIAHTTAVGVSQQGEVVAADRRGQVHVLTLSGNVASSKLSVQIQALTHTGTGWLACGHRGALLSSQNGYQWATERLPLSAESQRHCTWHTIQQFGNEIWVAGKPGTILLYSPNRGASWAIKPTGQTGTINDVKFIDDQRGWAVGTQGKIWATRDGGRSWYSQRNASKHLGLLSITHTASDIPWSPIISAAWDEKVSVGALVMSASDRDDQADFFPSQSAQLLELAPQLSICCSSAAGPHRAAASNPAEDVAEELAVSIMSLRPKVILTSNATNLSDPKLPDLALATRAAMSMAMDPASLIPTIARELHLRTWSVAKLAAVTESGTSGYREQSGRVLKSLGLAIWDVLLALPPDVRQSAETTEMNTLWSDTRNKAADASLFGGLAIPAEARRETGLSGLVNLQLVMGREYRKRSMEQLASNAAVSNAAASNAAGSEQWLQGLSFILQNHPPQEIVPALIQLIDALAAAETSDRRQAALTKLVELDPMSDAATWAMSQLLIEDASDELAAWRFAAERIGGAKPIGWAGAQQNTSVSQAEIRKPWNASPFASDANSESSASAVVTASATAPARPVARHPDPQMWFESFSRFSTHAPHLISRPDLQMLSYSMSRGGERAREAARLESLLTDMHLPAWHQVARQELLLHANRVTELNWIALAVPTYTRPRLDGHLDEDFWKRIPLMQLADQEILDQEAFSQGALLRDQRRQGAFVRWAYDSQYVYIGLQCPLEQAVAIPPVQRVRSYDADLSGQDNVSFLMDTDRDYSSCVEFAVSQDGRTYDRCLDRKEFDPKWHVAVNEQAETWTAELAIELRYITTDVNLVGKAWAVSAWRRRPGKPAHTWGRFESGPPKLTDAGLLLFVPSQD